MLFETVLPCWGLLKFGISSTISVSLSSLYLMLGNPFDKEAKFSCVKRGSYFELKFPEFTSLI